MMDESVETAAAQGVSMTDVRVTEELDRLAELAAGYVGATEAVAGAGGVDFFYAK